MIYIDPSNHKFFHILAKFFRETICKGEITEITTDYTKQGIWLLTYASFVNRVHDVLPSGSTYIAVQTENDAKFAKTGYREFLAGAIKVYDYQDNLIFGYADVWRLEMEDAKDIDVLFYGAVNKKRAAILDRIPNVFIPKDLYGAELQQTIMRSKIVLNVHYYDNNDSSWDRIPSLVCNKVFLISERFNSNALNDTWEDCITIASGEKIPELCEYYLNNPIKRLEKVDRAFDVMKNQYKSMATPWQDKINKYR